MEKQTTIEEVTEVEAIEEVMPTKAESTKKKAKSPELVNSEETEKEEDENIEGVYVHKFKTPFEDSGEVYEEITFDINALKGSDLIAIEQEMKLQGVFGEMLEVSKAYQSHVAVRAASRAKKKTVLTADVMKRMPLKEFFKITNKVRDFLMETGGM